MREQVAFSAEHHCKHAQDRRGDDPGKNATSQGRIGKPVPYQRTGFLAVFLPRFSWAIPQVREVGNGWYSALSQSRQRMSLLWSSRLWIAFTINITLLTELNTPFALEGTSVTFIGIGEASWRTGSVRLIACQRLRSNGSCLWQNWCFAPKGARRVFGADGYQQVAPKGAKGWGMGLDAFRNGAMNVSSAFRISEEMERAREFRPPKAVARTHKSQMLPQTSPRLLSPVHSESRW